MTENNLQALHNLEALLFNFLAYEVLLPDLDLEETHPYLTLNLIPKWS